MNCKKGASCALTPKGARACYRAVTGAFSPSTQFVRIPGGRLEDGHVEQGCVICPVHGARFELATGKVSPDTPWATELETFELTIEDDELLSRCGLTPAGVRR